MYVLFFSFSSRNVCKMPLHQCTLCMQTALSFNFILVLLKIFCKHPKKNSNVFQKKRKQQYIAKILFRFYFLFSVQREIKASRVGENEKENNVNRENRFSMSIVNDVEFYQKK